MMEFGPNHPHLVTELNLTRAERTLNLNKHGVIFSRGALIPGRSKVRSGWTTALALDTADLLTQLFSTTLSRSP